MSLARHASDHDSRDGGSRTLRFLLSQVHNTDSKPFEFTSSFHTCAPPRRRLSQRIACKPHLSNSASVPTSSFE